MPTPPERSTLPRNRRGSRRLSPRGMVKVCCRKGGLDLGPNIALDLVNASETGICLSLSTGLDTGQDVFLTLDRPTGGKPIRRAGIVIWAQPADHGCLAGIRLAKPLRYSELAFLAHL